MVVISEFGKYDFYVAERGKNYMLYNMLYVIIMQNLLQCLTGDFIVLQKTGMWYKNIVVYCKIRQ